MPEQPSERGHEHQIDQVVADYLQRLDRGEPIDRAELLDTHAEIAGALQEFFSAEQTLGEIQTSDRVAGGGTSISEKLLRIRCPHCQTPDDVAVDTPLVEIVCESCGNRFSLVGDQHDSRATSSLRSVGHFELIKRIGVGGFGSVWKAHDSKLDRVVAVKIPRQIHMDLGEMEKFFREARTAAQLKHPNIVAVHEVGREGETVYIVCDLVHGLSLADWLNRQQPTRREAIELCAKIAGALHYAHEQGVVHRDLKPSNIMIDGHGEPHLMDFGLARREVGDVTITLSGQVLGTPAYMSPEQAQGEAHSADRRTDVYSLGVILYQLITGELPFRGNVRMLMQQVIHEMPPSPRKLNGNLSKDLETVCLKCLEKDPHRRYRTADELAEELGRLLSGEPVLARPIGKLAHLGRWCRRKPVVASLIGIAGVLVLLVMIVTTVAYVRTSIALEQEAAVRKVAERERQAALDAKQREERHHQEADRQREVATQARNHAQQSQRTARKNLYAAHMTLIHQAWERSAIGTVRNLLIRELPQPGYRDLRDYSWHYFWQACHADRMTLYGHVDWVNGVTFSADGALLATASRDGTTRLWDSRTGKERVSLKIDGGEVAWVAFSPDGTTLLTEESGNVIVWDLAQGLDRACPIRTWSVGSVYNMALSPDGKRLAAGDAEGRVRIWATATGKLRGQFQAHPNKVFGVTFSPDGSKIATGSIDGTVKLWDAVSHDELVVLQGHAASVTPVVFSPDGKLLATGGGRGVIKIWDVVTAHELRTLSGHAETVEDLAFSADGNRLVSGCISNEVKLWDVRTGHELNTYRGHTDEVWSVAFSPDGRELASASHDGTVKLWGVDSIGQSYSIHGHAGRVHCVEVSPDAKMIASAGEDGLVKLWDYDSLEVRSVLHGHQATIESLTFSPDSALLVSGCKDHTAKVWDLATLTLRGTLAGHDGWVETVAFSPAGSLLATGSHDAMIKLWETKNLQEQTTLQGPPGWVRSLCFSPNGLTLAVSQWDCTVMWNLATHRDKVIFGHPGGSLAESQGETVCFSPDGRWLGTTGHGNTVRVWDAATFKQRLVLKGHIKQCRCVRFSPQGDLLATGGKDATVRIWDANTGHEYLTLDADDDVFWLAFTPDGRDLVAATAAGTLKFWHLVTSSQSENHPEVARWLKQRADDFAAQGENGKAERHYRNSLAMHRQLLGEENALTGRVMLDLAKLLARRANPPFRREVKSLLSGAEKIFADRLAPSHSWHAEVEGVLVELGSAESP